jgi:NADPH2:quinone reductase
MRAWRTTEKPGIESLEIVDAPVPEPGDGEVLLRVASAALNFSDLLMIDDTYQVRPPRPFIPGQEVSGTVEAAGPGVGIGVGSPLASKVYWGGFAEYAIVRADMAIPVPDDMELQRAATIPVVYPTAIVALSESTKVEPGERVLIHAAAGGVGLASVQVAKALGATVLATAGSSEKCALATANGADYAFDYSRDDWVQGVKDATGDAGVDVVVDPVGGDVTLQSLRCLAWEGRLLIVGFSSGEIPAIPANRLLLKRASAIGVYWSHERDAALIADVTDRMVAMCADGRLKPHVGTAYEFSDLPRALADLRARRSVGKSVLTVARG